MNEATFRQINEGVRAAEGAEGLIGFFCECGRLGCNQLMRLSRAEYEAVREDPRRFAILPGRSCPRSRTSSSVTSATRSSKSTPTAPRSSNAPTRAGPSTSRATLPPGVPARAARQPRRGRVRICPETLVRPAMLVGFDIGPSLTDPRAQRRVALNQATLRKLNEAMNGGAGGGLISFRCECGQLGCNQLLRLRHGEYEAVRAHPRRFAIVPGHEVGEIEAPIERDERSTVVETRAPAATAVAEQTSPRH